MFSSLDIMFTICLLPSNPYIDVNGELVSAVSNIEDLIKTQKRIIDNLDYYFHKEDKRLARMKKFLDTFQREHKNAKKDVHTYLSNPIIFFSFLKRISIDLDHIKDYSIIKAEYLMNFTLVDKSLEYPTQKDLKGTAEVIAVLQETYKLDVKELAAGKLNGVLYSAPMTAGDCYELGRKLYQCVEYVKVCAWMIEAFRKYHKEKNDYYFTEVDILEYIIFAYFLLDDMENALKWTYTLLDTHPNNSRAKHNIPLYLKKIALKKSKLGKIQNVKALSEPDIMEIYNKVQKAYEAQCRGETVITSKTDRRLTCRYLSKNHAFLKIAPLKMEIIFINPDVVLFHDVLSDIEIEKLKKTARSKSAHINCTKHDKSRIATVMFYMSEVALGGATVFTHLGLTVYPIKGAAVFWYNTHPSGERNPAMIHAACPVLLGSKWGKQYLGLDPVYDQADLVSNKFIRHCGQEFSNHVTWCAKTHFDPEL